MKGKCLPVSNSAIQTTGLIIREQKVSENDRLVTVITKDLGVIRAFCPGALKVSGKRLSSTAFLSYSRLSISKSRDTYRITEATAEKIFWELRNDFTRLSLASYFCEVCGVVAPKEEPANDYLRLILNCLHMLSNESINVEKIKSIFELRSALYSGYMPDVTDCAKCGNELNGCFFDVVGGVCYCEKCAAANSFKGIFAVSLSVLTAIRHILYSPLEKAFSFNINPESMKILSDVSERFLCAQLNRSFDTLEFYKTYTV